MDYCRARAAAACPLAAGSVGVASAIGVGLMVGTG